MVHWIKSLLAVVLIIASVCVPSWSLGSEDNIVVKTKILKRIDTQKETDTGIYPDKELKERLLTAIRARSVSKIKEPLKILYERTDNLFTEPVFHYIMRALMKNRKPGKRLNTILSYAIAQMSEAQNEIDLNWKHLLVEGSQLLNNSSQLATLIDQMPASVREKLTDNVEFLYAIIEGAKNTAFQKVLTHKLMKRPWF